MMKTLHSFQESIYALDVTSGLENMMPKLVNKLRIAWINITLGFGVGPKYAE